MVEIESRESENTVLGVKCCIDQLDIASVGAMIDIRLKLLIS